MLLLWVLILSSFKLGSLQNVSLVSQTRSAFLEKYRSYTDVIIMHFRVPEDISFASFKFTADELDLSVFGCTPSNISLYLKYGSPPVINPDGSKFPDSFFDKGRPTIHELTLFSDKTTKYVNLSTPLPGDYYMAVFQSYTDPKYEGITQDGLTPECYTFMDASLYTDKPKVIEIITEGHNFTTSISPNIQRAFKIYVPDAVDHVLLTFYEVNYCTTCTKITLRIQANNVPTELSSIKSFEIIKGEVILPVSVTFWSHESTWHYITLDLEEANSATDKGSVTFAAKFFSSAIDIPKTIKISNKSRESSEPYKPSTKALRNEKSLMSTAYKQYNLLREGTTDSFIYTFDLTIRNEDEPLIPLNMSSKHFTVLKFHLHDAIDSGGTLHFVMAYKPKVTREGKMTIIEKEPSNHVIVGCIANGRKDIPTWPNKCSYNDKTITTPLILNKTQTNSSVMIPFPEAGDWFVSLKLFCGPCEPCDCSEKCRNDFTDCVSKCERDCVSQEKCNSCRPVCEESILNSVMCSGCDCDGPCKRSEKTCNTSIIFDVGSAPCVGGHCGWNGKCTYMVAEGFVYSSCYCRNNYRGWDCSDDSQANSLTMIIIELLLLTLSNIVFLPATYISIRRGYYVEAIVYASTCFFSTFYHACDAGENTYSFCIVRLAVLQFSDFYSGLMSIWVTLIAMAYIEGIGKNIFHMAGAILIAFGTTYNKTSLWVFLLPAIVGVLILAISWYIKYRKTQVLFPSKRYLYIILPLGFLIVGVGLLCYSLLQTKNNYKYLHSLWHVLMAVGLIVLLPNKETFLPKNIL